MAQSDPAAVNRLIENGVDPDATNGEGNTALHEALLKGDNKVIEALLAGGADARIRNEKGFSSGFLGSVIMRNSRFSALLMNTEDNSAEVVPIPLVSFGTLPRFPREFTSPAALIQWNPRFGYRFVASPFWQLQGIQQDGSFKRQSIVVVSLPPIWSESEKQSIENAISVHAKESPAITNLDLVVEDFLAPNTKRSPFDS